MATLQRVVEVEWLDGLPEDDPRAIASRRDLKRLNLLMGHAAIFERVLLTCWPKGRPRSILDLGAGDGSFMLSLARRLAAQWPGLSVTLLDRRRPPAAVIENFAALGWRADLAHEDVFEHLKHEGGRVFDIVVANLFLHHFGAQDLTLLFARFAKFARLFVAVEPRRSRPVLIASRSVWAIGANEVTRHDATTSARAGFAGQELTDLWPNRDGWETHERPAGAFSHCFMARRRA
jgi:SAM-dependent methyltransferase